MSPKRPKSACKTPSCLTPMSPKSAKFTPGKTPGKTPSGKGKSKTPKKTPNTPHHGQPDRWVRDIWTGDISPDSVFCNFHLTHLAT